MNNISKDNKDIMLSAVNYDGLTLKYASKRLKTVKDIITTAIPNNPGALYFIERVIVEVGH
uniref:DUF4116 domain-containing protein n=1 Tax=viral metagenome TaxID=1070528 RepID=A0A6C0JE97_9ZZZZ